MAHDIVSKLIKRLNDMKISDYHGLSSPGLTCYLNSVLQVLFMTVEFRETVKLCSSDNSSTFDSHLARLFVHLEKDTADTRAIAQELGITDVYKQCDAAEYFEKILSLSCPEASQIFRGELSHKTACLKCKERNDSRSCFWILPLALEDLHPHIHSVETALKSFFNREIFSGDNKIYCNRCQRKRDAEFECEVTHHPEILTLLLKRFRFDSTYSCYVKLKRQVEVPQTLSLEDFTYDLYALVKHSGTLTGGHYTALIKSFENGEWYDFNDLIVEIVKEPLFKGDRRSLRSCRAYLLMYRKVNKCSVKVKEAQFPHSGVEGRRDEKERGEGLKDDEEKHWSPFTGEKPEPMCAKPRKRRTPGIVAKAESDCCTSQKSKLAKTGVPHPCAKNLEQTGGNGVVFWTELKAEDFFWEEQDRIDAKSRARVNLVGASGLQNKCEWEERVEGSRMKQTDFDCVSSKRLVGERTSSPIASRKPGQEERRWDVLTLDRNVPVLTKIKNDAGQRRIRRTRKSEGQFKREPWREKR
ncbi:uncharacterized protein ACBR49_019113 [Aulostomus maculatus]